MTDAPIYILIAVALIPAAIICIGCGAYAWWRLFRWAGFDPFEGDL